MNVTDFAVSVIVESEFELNIVIGLYDPPENHVIVT